VLLLVVQEHLEQVVGDVVLDRVATRGSLLVWSARRHFQLQVTIEDLGTAGIAHTLRASDNDIADRGAADQSDTGQLKQPLI